MASCAKIEDSLLCVQERLPVFVQVECETQTRGFLSAAAVSSFIELEFIIQPFFCVMCPPEQSGEGGRGRERQRRGPSNSTGVHTHWIV